MQRMWVMGLSSLLWIFSTSGLASASELKLTSGVDVSTGDYGLSEATDMVIVPTTIGYSNFPWKFTANVNYFDVRGPGDVVIGIDGVIAQDASTDSHTTGFGDVSLSGSWAADSHWDMASFFLDLSAKIKLPTADETTGLSTGNTDTQLQADLAYGAGSVTPMATLGYKFSGGAEYANQLIASIGFNYQWQEPLNTGVFLDYRDAATSTSENRQEAFVYLTRALNSKFSVTIYGVKGFTTASPDLGVGLTLSIKSPL